MSPSPFLIIGQGLAGTAIAWRLWERGVPFLIVDREEAVTSSKVAAGLLTPITGMRMSLSEHYAPWLCESVKFYRARERQLGVRFLHACGHVRWFKNDKETQRWAKRADDAESLRFVRTQTPSFDPSVFNIERGGFEMKHAGWLDTAEYLTASRDFFARSGQYVKTEFSAQELVMGEDDVQWRGTSYREVIFCTGWEAMHLPWFDWVPFEPVRGTILTARADLKNERRIMHGACWILPRADGTLRVGSTYDTTFPPRAEIDAAKLADLHARLSAMVKVPVEILAESTAVRPAIALQRTLIGRHPAKPRLVFFNGLGSKGTLRSPPFARILTEHLLDQKAIPPELDVAGNL
jgi:glycine/D-amino acid oxidase-like deaminating enzyme